MASQLKYIALNKTHAGYGRVQGKSAQASLDEIFKKIDDAVKRVKEGGVQPRPQNGGGTMTGNDRAADLRCDFCGERIAAGAPMYTLCSSIWCGCPPPTEETGAGDTYAGDDHVTQN